MNRPLCCRKAAQCDVKQKAGFIPAFFMGKTFIFFAQHRYKKTDCFYTVG